VEPRVEVEARLPAEDWDVEQIQAAKELDVRVDGKLVVTDEQPEREEDAQPVEAEL
jgi:hypothetical protein